jgi:hypothetical protein
VSVRSRSASLTTSTCQLLHTSLDGSSVSWYARDALRYAEGMRFESHGPHKNHRVASTNRGIGPRLAHVLRITAGHHNIKSRVTQHLSDID